MDIRGKVVEILVDMLGIDASEITDDASLIKDLGIDSLDYAELVMEFEQNFGIKIPDEDAGKLGSVGSIVNYINGKLNQ